MQTPRDEYHPSRQTTKSFQKYGILLQKVYDNLIGDIQIICDTFWQIYDLLPPHFSFGNIVSLMYDTTFFLLQKHSFFKVIKFYSKNGQKMSRETLLTPSLPHISPLSAPLSECHILFECTLM